MDLPRHGTYVAGVAAAVAPKAKILSLDVYNGTTARWSDVVRALNWVVANKDTYSICSAVMALGGADKYTAACGQTAEAAAILEIRSAGILTAAAAGNDAYRNGLTRPSCAPATVSVGATYDDFLGSMPYVKCRDASSSPTTVTCYSNSASFLTLLAPGDTIEVAGSVEGGTSLAAPHMGGAIAVLKSAVPAATPDQIVAALVAGGVPIKDRRNGLTKPRLDIQTSLALLQGGAALHINDRGKWAARRLLALTVRTLVAAPAGATVCVSDGGASEADCCATRPLGGGSVAFNLTSDGDGEKTVYAFIRAGPSCGDAVIARAQQTVVLDSTPPAGAAARLAGGAAITRTAAVTLHVEGTDAGSGLADEMCVALSAAAGKAPKPCTAWQPFKTTSTVTLSNYAGNHTARVTLRDKVGNEATAEATVIFDALLPTQRAFRGKAVDNTTISLTWAAATDAVTGLDGYSLVYQSGSARPASGCVASPGGAGPVFAVTPAPGAGDTSAVVSGLEPNSAYAFRLCARDVAGNVAAGKAWGGKTLK
jgi:hypothetical protein